VPSDDELDVILSSRPDDSEDPEDGGAEEEEGEEDDPTQPKFIKNGELDCRNWRVSLGKGQDPEVLARQIRDRHPAHSRHYKRDLNLIHDQP
jgi:hypothetical protein